MNTTTQFSLLGILFVLLTLVAFSVIRTAGRKRRSPLAIPDGAKVLRLIVCSLLIIAACYHFYDIMGGVLTGKILDGHYTKFISSHFFIVYRVDEPDRFWAVVCWDCFYGLMLLYFAFAEIFIAAKRGRHFKPKSPV